MGVGDRTGTPEQETTMANNYLPCLFDFENAMQEQENRMKNEALLSHMVHKGYEFPEVLPSVAPSGERTSAQTHFETANPTQDYLVLTDSEMEQQAYDYISDSLWAFQPDWLAWYMGDHVTVDTVKTLQDSGLCEGLNEPFRSMVGDNFDRLVKDAISSDGYGHFLSPYDGEHHEFDGFNIFRQN